MPALGAKRECGLGDVTRDRIDASAAATVREATSAIAAHIGVPAGLLYLASNYCILDEQDRAKAGAFVAAIAYRKGAAVALVGLKTQELNGQSGVVVKELSAATGRIGVKLASRRVVAVKPANLSRT